MGLSCTNVQVHTSGGDATAVRAALIAALRRHVLVGPFVEVADPDERVDRMVAVAPAGPEPWIAVFDEAVESEADERPLLALTQALSTVVPGATLAIRVYDSDAADLFLFRNGRRVDAYSNDPTYPGWRTPRQQRQMTGHAERWQDLLVDGASAEMLRAAWAAQPLFAEDIVEQFAPLLGLSPTWCLAELEDALRAEAEGVTVLRFRSTAPPPMTRITDGAPRFRWSAGGGHRAFSLGDTPRFFASVVSAGGPSRGVTLVLTGSALDQRLFVPTSVHLRGIRVDEDGWHEEVREVRFAREQHGQTWVQAARSDDMPIPAGVTPSVEELQSQRQVSSRAWEALKWEVRLSIDLLGTAMATGQGELLVTIAPLANPDEGAAHWSMPLAVAGHPRRPLRASPAVSTATLRQLESPTRLVALIALGADRDTCAALAGELCERWSTLSQRGDEPRYEVVLQHWPHTRPVTSHLRAKRLAASRRWREVRSALATCQVMSGGIGWGRAGFTFDTVSSSVPLGAPTDRIVPHLALYDSLANLGTEEQAAAIAAVVELVDEGMVKGAGLQALVARWDWRPVAGIGRTPYEIACDIDGHFMNGRAWCTRYLRGVAERLWLGPDLIAHLGNPRPLAHLAEVTPVGTALRVVLAAASSLDDLEQALAPLLPSGKDVEAAGQPRRPGTA